MQTSEDKLLGTCLICGANRWYANNWKG